MMNWPRCGPTPAMQPSTNSLSIEGFVVLMAATPLAIGLMQRMSNRQRPLRASAALEILSG